MTIERAISDITSMPLEDQILVVQAVWDRMSNEAGTQLTEKQRTELDRRLAEYQENPESSLNELELREQVRKARR